jgi:hypothetical protein
MSKRGVATRVLALRSADRRRPSGLGGDGRNSLFHPKEGEVQMKRLAGVIAALTLGALVLAGTAGATKPYMERDVQGPDTLGETCSFPVLIQPTAPDVLNFFVFSDGEVFGAGPFVGTATNLDTGKTVKINLSGHFSVVEHSDGTVTVTSDGSVLSTLFGIIFSGHSVIELDASGNVTSRTFSGTEEDLCAELAGP